MLFIYILLNGAGVVRKYMKDGKGNTDSWQLDQLRPKFSDI